MQLVENVCGQGGADAPTAVALSGANPRTDLLWPLDKMEQEQLNSYEQTLEKGLGTFFEVGRALLTIRERRLYRSTHYTFEEYCRERWNIGRSYAWRVMGAAQRIKLLKDSDAVPKPENEFQIRPFLKLAPEVFPGVWKQVVKSARQGKITARIVKEVVQNFLPNREPLDDDKRRFDSKRKFPMGQVLALLHDVETKVKKSQNDAALAALERIESLLFADPVAKAVRR